MGSTFKIGIMHFPFFATHKSDGFKQSPLKIISGFRESNFLYLLQVYKGKKKPKPRST